MKIGFLTTYFYPFTGGAESNIYNLAKELVKNSHEVHVFTSDRKEKKRLKREEVQEGIQIHRARTIFRYKYYFVWNPSLLSKILKTDLDILHVNSLGFLWHDIIVLLKKATSKTKIVNTPHGPFMALPEYKFHQKIIKKIITAIERPINKQYDLVIQVNPNQKKWMKKIGIKEEKIRYLPNGIEKDFLKEPTEKEKKEFLRKYNIENKFIVSYLGRIQRYKGNHQVIEALKGIKGNITFLMMGADLEGEKKRLEEQAKKTNVNLKLIEEISEKEKKIALATSEIFILPSQWEAFGIVLLEAMAQRNAIISTTTEGANFLIKKENGCLFEYNDIPTLRNHLIKLIKNKNKRKQMQKNNRKKAKRFIWDKITKRLERIYKEKKKINNF